MANRNRDKIIWHIQNQVILVMCLLMMGAMWWDLAAKIESGKPFELNKKTYKAIEVVGVSEKESKK